MIDLWFGDSYVLGAELNYLGPYTLNEPRHKFVREQDRPDLSFAHIASGRRGNNYINLAAGGSSIEYQLYMLTQFCKSEEFNSEENYTAFFCLPFQERRFTIKNNGESERIHIRRFWHSGKDLNYILYSTTMVLNSIYNLCVRYKIIPYFIPIYSPIHLMNGVIAFPSSCWLVDPSSHLVKEAWGLEEEVKSWRSRKIQKHPMYQKFVKPCKNHPNLLGHKMLAHILLKKIK